MSGLSFDELSVSIGYALLFSAGAATSSAKPVAVVEAKKEAPKKEVAKKDSKEDDFDDLFGDDEEEVKPKATVAGKIYF